jgi:hypothetical protein
MPGGFPIDIQGCNGTDQGTVAGTSLGTVVTGNTSADAMGAFTQLIAASACDSAVISVSLYNPSANSEALNIAVGAAASEKVIIQQLMVDNGVSMPIGTNYIFPIAIPAGTRISAQIQGNSASATSRVAVYLFDAGFSPMEGCAGVDSIGFVTANTTGTTLTASSSTNTKGSYAQLSASTPRDYLALWAYFDALNTTATNAAYLCDIAIGAGGSEKVIIPNLFQQCSSVAGNGPFLSGIAGPFPICIPAGTRVAARIQATTASAKCGLTLYGVYQ